MPNFTPGDFTPAAVLQIKRKSTDLFTRDRSLAELNLPIQAASCLLSGQDVALEPVLRNGKCIGMTVVYHRSCNLTVSDGAPADSCTITGAQLGAEAVTYDAEGIGYTSFSVMDDDCGNMFTWEDNVARGDARAKALLEAHIAQKLVAFLGAEADTVLQAEVDAAFDTTATVSGNSIQVNSSLWTPKLLADMEYIAEQNQIFSPIIISGKNFYNDAFLSQFNSPYCCNNNDILNDERFKICFDKTNVDSTLGGRYTFFVDPGSFVFWNTKEYKTEQPHQLDGNTYSYYSILPRLRYNNRGTLEPIYVDVLSQRSCTDGKWGWTFRYTVTGGIHKSIDDCGGKYGILKYEYVTE